MGTASNARELRRETKRTLGHKLEEFAGSQHKRLIDLEASVGELLPPIREKYQTIGQCASLAAANASAALAALDAGGLGNLIDARLLEAQVRALMEIRHRGFFGRLNWALFGK